MTVSAINSLTTRPISPTAAVARVERRAADRDSKEKSSQHSQAHEAEEDDKPASAAMRSSDRVQSALLSLRQGGD